MGTWENKENLRVLCSFHNTTNFMGFWGDNENFRALWENKEKVVDSKSI